MILVVILYDIVGGRWKNSKEGLGSSWMRVIDHLGTFSTGDLRRKIGQEDHTPKDFFAHRANSVWPRLVADPVSTNNDHQEFCKFKLNKYQEFCKFKLNKFSTYESIIYMLPACPYEVRAKRRIHLSLLTMANDAALEVDVGMEANNGDNDEEDDQLLRPNIVILSVAQVLESGLHLLGWTEKRLGHARRTHEANIDQYRSMYGINPYVMAQLCEDLQTTKIENARIDPKQIDIDKLHWTLHWLYRYPTEKERESIWHKSANTVRDAAWFYVEKIRSLKAQKITWPGKGHWKSDDIWVMTVDGTHLVILEPGDSDVPKDPSYFSFKHHAAGFNYEVGVDLFESRCIWLSGPHKAGTYNDAKMFSECGLKHKLEKSGKVAIADDGYRGFPNQISTANSLDSEAVRVFKVRARQRHEIYNSKLKQFAILSERFHCKNNTNDKFTVDEKLQMCFEAVNVLVQYKMEMGEPLFDI